MNRIFLLALTAGLFSTISAEADLGKAETDLRKKEKIEKSSFSAWCARPRNKCKILFNGDRLTVDKSKGIDRNQIKSYWEELKLTKRSDVIYHYFITYEKIDKSGDSTGEFIFTNYEESIRFWNTLKKFTETLNLPMGPT